MVKHIILWTLNPELSEEDSWGRFPDSSMSRFILMVVWHHQMPM